MGFKLSDFNEKTRRLIQAQLDAGAIRSRSAQGTEPDQRREGQDQGMESPAAGLVYRITLIQCRHRLLDGHDSLPFSVKPLVDQITGWLGFESDSDTRLKWEYGQVKTSGSEGVIVKISV